MKKTKRVALAGILSVSVLTSAGCGFIKPYDKPSYVEIKPNQTAFVIPLEGKTSDQGQFQSEEYLQKKQVASKRIKVEHEWIKTGRLSGSGKYVDKVRVIVVDRYPETREWKNDNAFIGESKDSVKFNQGISATAQITEDDAATFLYQYSGKSLKEVMDKEIRNKIGSVLLEKYSTSNIEKIRANKSEVIKHVSEVVTPYFKERGITLSNIGYIGDMKYTDEKIQEAINKKFNAQEEQNAQRIMNQTEIAKAKAEAKANNTRKQAMQEIREMKELEIKEKWVEKWDGKLPQVQTGNDGNIISIPKTGK